MMTQVLGGMFMSNVGDRIRDRRMMLKMTQEELAVKVGYKSKNKKSTINKIEKGINDLRRSKVTLYAQALQTSEAYLMGWVDDPELTSEETLKQETTTQTKGKDNLTTFTTYKVPILGSIACGEPIYSPESADVYVSVSKGLHADFALIAKGDSMIGEHIFDGDIVMIRTQPEVELGQIAAISINDEVTLKHTYYYPETQKLILQSANPKYEPMVYVGEELNTIRILGKAVAVQHVLN